MLVNCSQTRSMSFILRHSFLRGVLVQKLTWMVGSFLLRRPKFLFLGLKHSFDLAVDVWSVSYIRCLSSSFHTNSSASPLSFYVTSPGKKIIIIVSIICVIIWPSVYIQYTKIYFLIFKCYCIMYVISIGPMRLWVGYCEWMLLYLNVGSIRLVPFARVVSAVTLCSVLN